MRLRRPLHGPQHPRGPSRGRDVRDFVKRTLNRLPAQIPVGEDFFPKPPGGWDSVYNAKTTEAVSVIQRFNDISPASGNMGQATLDALWQYADPYSKWVYRLYRPPSPVPALGPVWRGGKSLLLHDLTHATSSVPLYPALDDGFVAGREIIAPEDLIVTKASSSRPGAAFYADGASGLRYWFGHLVSSPAVGRRFRKGDVVGVVLDHSIGGGPHVHVGINVEELLGAGRELEHRTDYRHGAPLVGDQLRKALT